MSKIKYMNIKEFREKGYLQEVNRRFFHPLGLALEVVIDDKTGEERLGGIWDYREDKEGIYYGIKNSNKERKDRFKKNADFINNEMKKRAKIRMEMFGSIIEPIEE